MSMTTMNVLPVAPVGGDDGPAAATPKRGTRRAVLLIGVLAGAITAVYLSPVRTWLADTGHVRRAVQSLGLWIYPVGILSIALLVGCGVPRLLLCTVAGMTLGFWRGLLLGELGTVLGYYGVFLFIRWGGREWALHRWPKLQKWADLVRGQGILGVILLRQIPIHGTLMNLGLGISRIKHRHFLIGTAIGVIPESIPATLVGTGLGKGSAKAIGGYLALAAVAFALIWIACAYGMRAMRRSRAAAALVAGEAELKAAAE
jgi:uncharacterized membrane protein YdjX (TVP38/TMEM64 family)